MGGTFEDNDIQTWLQLARTLARQAGDLVLSIRHPASGVSASNMLSIETKSNATDLVTSADMASQNLIFSALKKAHPTHRLIGEEDSEEPGPLDDRPTWIVDAIDGTTNFVHGLSDWAVSIGIALHARPVAGVVYNPKTRELFSGRIGGGAFLNDLPLHTGSAKQLSEAMVVSEWGYAREEEKVRKMLFVNEKLLTHGTRGIRQIGSGSLDICYVGAGRVDAVYCGVVGSDAWKIWDYAAACVIATEAGAVMRTVDGGEFDIEAPSMVCATPGVMEELLQVLKSCR